MNSEIKFELCFPTLFFKKEIENFSLLKNVLLKKIYDLYEINSGLERSNCGGWHSENITTDKTFEPYLILIERQIKECLVCIMDDTDFIISDMWININKRGDFNRTHTHPETDFSGVLWVNIDGDESGNIEFENPNLFEQSKLLHRLKEKIKDDYNIHRSIWMPPREGNMVIFPSNIRHLVFPNKSNQDRVSIAFNVNLK